MALQLRITLSNKDDWRVMGGEVPFSKLSLWAFNKNCNVVFVYAADEFILCYWSGRARVFYYEPGSTILPCQQHDSVCTDSFA